MNKEDTFISQRCWLRGISEKDTDCIVKWRSDLNVIRYFRRPVPISWEEQQQWYETYCRNLSRFDFIVIAKDTNQPIGTVGVNNINWETQTCEISYMIAEPGYQRHGYAVEAITSMMIMAFSHGIHHFFAEIHRENLPSIRTIQKIGFSVFEEHPPFIIYHKQEKLNCAPVAAEYRQNRTADACPRGGRLNRKYFFGIECGEGAALAYFYYAAICINVLIFLGGAVFHGGEKPS